MFSGYAGLTASLEEEEQELIATLLEELGLYFSRRKGAGNELFANDWDAETESQFEDVSVKLPKN